jgi:hypothetical protein
MLPKLQNRSTCAEGSLFSVCCTDLAGTIGLPYERGNVMGEPSGERVVSAVLA